MHPACRHAMKTRSDGIESQREDGKRTARYWDGDKRDSRVGDRHHCEAMIGIHQKSARAYQRVSVQKSGERNLMRYKELGVMARAR